MSNADDFSDLFSIFESVPGERHRTEQIEPNRRKTAEQADVPEESPDTQNTDTEQPPDVSDAPPLAPTDDQKEVVASNQSSRDGLAPAATISRPIEDLGHIPGAAKERWSRLAGAYALEYGEEDMTSLPLSKLLPEPNYAKLAEEGVNQDLLALVCVIRSTTPTKPRKRHKLKSWVSFVKDARGAISTVLNAKGDFSDLLSTPITKAELLVEQFNENTAHLVAGEVNSGSNNNKVAVAEIRKEMNIAITQASMAMYSKALTILSDEPENFPKLAKKLNILVQASYYENERSLSLRHTIVWNKRKLISSDHGQYQDVETSINKMLDKYDDVRQEVQDIISGESKKTKTKSDELEMVKKSLGLYQNRIDKTLIVKYKGAKKVFMRELAKFPGESTDIKGAREWFNQNIDVWAEEIVEQRKFQLRGAENSPRRGGTDWRQGRDISPSEFAEHFGLSQARALQYGNGILSAQKEAQQLTNDAFDALNDLAEALNLPPKAMSLGGELALAFGARGKGGRNSAMAHFENDQFVINLTRRNGAGSLAHEWFHALDNHLGKQYQPGQLDSVPMKRSLAFGTRQSVVRPAEDFVIRQSVSERLLELVKAIEGVPGRAKIDEKSAYYRSSLDMDATMRRTVPYWSATIEMAARAFEAYVIDRMTEQGVSNDFLVNLNPHRDDPEMLSVVPGFQAMEELGIRKAFENLFSALEVYQTQDNRMILHRLDENERQSVGALMDVVGKDADFFRYQHQDGSDLASMFTCYGYQVQSSRDNFWWNRISKDDDEIEVDHLYPVTCLYDCETPNGLYFTVYETDKSLWLDLSALGGKNVTLESGGLGQMGGIGGGNEIYQLVANYCYNTGKKLVGDPEGLSEIAVLRITESMISSALRYGTTQHFQPCSQQIEATDKFGNRIQGFHSLEWGNDDMSNLANLIQVSYNNVSSLIPEVAGVFFDEKRSEFRVRGGSSSLFKNATALASFLNQRGKEPFEVGEPWRGLETVLGRRLPPLARAMAGSSTLQRAVVIHSIVSKTAVKARGSDLAREGQKLFSDFAAVHTLTGKFYRDSDAAPSEVISQSHFDNVVEWTREVEKATGSEITVVKTSSDLPTRIGKSITPASKGLFDFASGNAYLIADRLVGRSETIKTALHEGLGHQGIIDFFECNADLGGRQLLTILDEVSAGVGMEAIEAKVGRYGFDLSCRRDRHQAVLEYIAHSAEVGVQPRAVNRLINAQTQLLESTFGGIVWTREDVLNLIEASKLYRLRTKAMEVEFSNTGKEDDFSARRAEIFWQSVQDAGGTRLAKLLGAECSVHLSVPEISELRSQQVNQHRENLASPAAAILLSDRYVHFFHNIGHEQGLLSEAIGLGVDLNPLVKASATVLASGSITSDQRVEWLVDEFIVHAVQKDELLSEIAKREIDSFIADVRSTYHQYGLSDQAGLSPVDLALTLKHAHRYPAVDEKSQPLSLSQREANVKRFEQTLSHLTGLPYGQTVLELAMCSPEPWPCPVAAAVEHSQERGVMFSKESVLQAIKAVYQIDEANDVDRRDVIWTIKDRLAGSSERSWAAIVKSCETELDCKPMVAAHSQHSEKVNNVVKERITSRCMEISPN